MSKQAIHLRRRRFIVNHHFIIFPRRQPGDGGFSLCIKGNSLGFTPIFGFDNRINTAQWDVIDRLEHTLDFQFTAKRAAHFSGIVIIIFADRRTRATHFEFFVHRKK
ncbi:hypothetical protein VIM7927_04400 [Vibrio mangrovi]|uniref:Uncharacterized protein n=1 Tax=Vibrio mangrovi TaxID=474394 RepID=A0A1Y6IZF6_9VIBR|nr:hypothetical protein VIM7927_04400 [Vibrio mangrovi]